MMDQSGTWFYRKLDLSHSYRGSRRCSPAFQLTPARRTCTLLPPITTKPVFEKSSTCRCYDFGRSNSIELLWNIDYLADQVLAYRFSHSAPAHLAERTNSSMPGVQPMLKRQRI